MDSIREQLAELHESAFGWAMVCCRHDRDVAADILQKAYCRILAGDASFGKRSTFATWVFGVIRNVALEEMRRRQRDQRRFSSFSEQATNAHPMIHHANVSFERQELAARLRSAMDELSDRQREMLHLTFYEDMTVEQAAKVLRIGVGSARQHYHRAKAALQRKLRHWELER